MTDQAAPVEPGWKVLRDNYGGDCERAGRNLTVEARRWWGLYYLPENPGLVEVEVRIAEDLRERLATDPEFAKAWGQGWMRRKARERIIWRELHEQWNLRHEVSRPPHPEAVRTHACARCRPDLFPVQEDLGVQIEVEPVPPPASVGAREYAGDPPLRRFAW